VKLKLPVGTGVDVQVYRTHSRKVRENPEAENPEISHWDLTTILTTFELVLYVDLSSRFILPKLLIMSTTQKALLAYRHALKATKVAFNGTFLALLTDLFADIY
jgi:hypothetical protein